MSKTALDIYLSEIKNNILTPEEEFELIRTYQNKHLGWEEAKDKIIKSNLLFVAKSAFEMTGDRQRASELISEGNLSLLESLDKFDQSKGCRFLTYAAFDIKGRMLKYLARNNYYSALKVSLKNVELANKARIFIKNCEYENNCRPSISEIANHCGIDESKALLIAELANLVIQPVIQVIAFEDEETKIYEIKDESNSLPDQEASNNSTSSILLKIVESLPLKQRIVINKRFGLNGESVTDLATIGEELNLTKERIRQIESSVLKIIRKELEKIAEKSAFV